MEVTRSKTGSTRSMEAIVFTAVLLAFTLVLLASTFSLRASSAMVPRLVGLPLVALLGYRLVREMSGRAPRVEDGQPELPDQDRRKVDLDGRHGQRADEIGAILWLLALPALSTVLGFVAGPALYVFAWTRYRADERMVVAVAAAAFTAMAIWILFVRLVGSPLWQGLLGALV